LKPLSDFEVNDYGSEEMTDLVETLRKSVTEALGKAQSKHKIMKEMEKGKISERIPRLK
jgi:hypothetical protein